MRCALALLLALAATGASPGTRAQPADALVPPRPDSLAGRWATSGALVFSLTEDGLGAGLSGRLGLSDDVSLTAEVGAAAARDAREQRFFVGFLGDSVTPFKRSYAVLVPLVVGIEGRLFREAVEDNFRPYAAWSAGPTLAVQWPYFDDRNGNGQRERGEARLGATGGLGEAEARWGVAAAVAVGAYLGRRRDAVQGVRLGLMLQYVPGGVDLLELDPAVERPSRRTFWSPTVSFLVVRVR